MAHKGGKIKSIALVIVHASYAGLKASDRQLVGLLRENSVK